MVYDVDMDEVETRRTNIEIDVSLMREARQLVGAASMRETVDVALRELVRRRRRRRLRELRGAVDWVGDLDEMRRSRFE